jgi:DNA-binding transcriptional LysR family regulator
MTEFADHNSIGPDSLANKIVFDGTVDFEKMHAAMTFKSNSDLAQLAMVRAGYGIGGIQMQLAARNPLLVPVLHEEFSIKMEMWLVTHEDIINNRPIRMFFDHLARHLDAYVHQR